jgi:hypothetical protein
VIFAGQAPAAQPPLFKPDPDQLAREPEGE